MPPVVIDLSQTDDERDVVHRVVEALTEGKVVAFPTETVYGLGASALHAEAVERIREIKGRKAGHPLTLAVKSADDALDYVPDILPLGKRLARRCWPGPITIVLDNSHPESVLKQLPENVQQAVCPNGTIGLRVPAHQLVLSVLRLCAGPLVLTSANRTGKTEAVNAEQVLDQLGDDVDLVLDDGESQFGKASSVVRVDRGGLQVLRSGVFTETTLKRLSNLMVLFVCTGNTCRSPMAEVLMRRRLADKMGCEIDGLEDRGVIVGSAGIAAMAGGLPSPEAVQIVKERDLDLASHQSQPLTDPLVRYADLILTMTRGHREAIVAQWPSAAPRTQTLCQSNEEIADPIGGPVELYRACAKQIDQQLEAWINELDLTK